MYMMYIDHGPYASSILKLLNLPCGLTTFKDKSSHRAYSPNLVEKRNSTKFAVASGSSTHRQAIDNRPCRPPMAPRRADLVAVVAPMCIKELRLVIGQLPEKSGLIGPGHKRTSPLRSSRKFSFGSGNAEALGG